MNGYVQIVLYFISIAIALYALWFVDFNKFIRVGHKQYAIFVYVVLSLALGFLIGKLFIELGTLIHIAW